MMNPYERNGLVFWDQREIRLRRMMADYFAEELWATLKGMNPAFEMVEVEAPLLTPRAKINPQYDEKDIYVIDDVFALRPETTMGSFAYFTALYNANKELRPPVCVYQHGKSFRREQDQPTKFMRLKEFHQLEFQIIYSPTTMMDYGSRVVPSVRRMITQMVGPCREEKSDRLPSYSEWTQDIVCKATDMEIASISQRKDLPGFKVLEVAIGTDRCVFNRLEWEQSLSA